jgi:hypothetical protein
LKRLLITILLFFTSLSASAPGVHYYLAERWLDLSGVSKEESRQEFLLGALFPDIRYLEKWPRKKTHESYPSLEMTDSAPTLFEAGMIFHAWVDVMRKFYLDRTKEGGELSFLPHEQQDSFLKFLDDDVLFSSGFWIRQSQFLKDISPSEKEKASLSSLKKWHFYLMNYFSVAPSDTLAVLYYCRVNFSRLSNQTLGSWKEELPRLAKEERWHKHLQGLIDEFEQKMKAYLASAHKAKTKTDSAIAVSIQN